MSSEDHDHSSVPAAGPWGAPAPGPTDQRPPRGGYAARGKWRRSGSGALFVLIMLSVGIHAYKDVSRPEAWAYWKDL